MRKLKIIGVDIFLQKRKTRLHAGVLSRENGKMVFIYDDHYFTSKNIIPLGPEFPLTQKTFFSDKLFPSLEDRIPSQQNPAYPEYCQSMGIDPKEKDPFILLSTIGKKGPSSFLFSPIFDRSIEPTDLTTFREKLGLTCREFAKVFEFSQTSLNTFEKNRSTGKDILKRLEILINYPDVASDLLFLNKGYISYEKWINAAKQLKNESR